MREIEKAKAFDVKELVEYAPNAIVSTTIVDTPAATITLFAFDEGQGLSEHAAPYDAVVQIVDGEAALTIGGQPITAGEGSVVIMPANVPHALKAMKRFKMVLTMIRASVNT